MMTKAQVMQAIPLWQPWASLWCSPRKIHETRTWPTEHRGWTAVHACAHRIPNVAPQLALICGLQFGRDWRKTLPRGGIIGMVKIVDCVPTTTIETDGDDIYCGDFGAHRFGIRRAEWLLLPEPIPFKGEQRKFFPVTEDVTVALMALVPKSEAA